MHVVYVPSHLYHIFFELFKNALRAVVEHHGSSATDYPPIEVRMSFGKEDVCIKVSDLGGGIPRSLSDLLFRYTYSTAPQPSPSGSGSAPLAGWCRKKGFKSFRRKHFGLDNNVQILYCLLSMSLLYSCTFIFFFIL
jgi:hypothetical protein